MYSQQVSIITSIVVKIHEVFVYRWGEIVQFMDGELLMSFVDEISPDRD